MKKFSFWIGLFLIYNLIFLSRLPIFNDESIYIHWGQMIITSPYRWWFPLRIDGKQPLYPILLGVATTFSPFKTLFSARLVSLFFGLLTFWSTVKIFQLLYPKKRKEPLYFLLITSCYLLFFNRLALMEAAITGLWYLAFYIFLLLIKKPSWKKSSFLGLILGLGWWIKSSMNLIFPLLFFTFLLTYWHLIKSNRAKVNLWPFFSSGLVFLILISPLFYSPHFNQISFQEKKWILSLQEVLNFPFPLWLNNLYKGFVWLIAYLTPLPFLLFMGYLLQNLKKPSKNFYLVLGWIFIPFFLQALIARRYTSRYLVNIVPAILIFSSLAWQEIKNSYLKKILILTILIPSLIFIASPITFFNLLPSLRPLKADQNQYINNWSSGYGIKETIEFLKKEALFSPLLIFVRHDYGNPEDALFALLNKEKNIKVVYINYQPLDQVKKLEKAGIKIYFISRGKQYSGLEKYLKEIIRFPKPVGDEFVGVYQFQVL